MNDMNEVFRPIIYPMDGCPTAAYLISDLTANLLRPGIGELIAMAKINDANFARDMSAPDLIDGIRIVGQITKTDIGIFNDLKTGDVSGTLKNITNRFRKNVPEILTVSAIIATEGFLKIRQTLPSTKIALFSVPTDMSVEECKARYNGMTPSEKIISDIEFFMTQWYVVLDEAGIDRTSSDVFEFPFDFVVCSPRELDDLNDAGMGQYFKWICPGIRDRWMEADHQKRTTGILEALQKGAAYAVMSTQLRKGSPKNGVSPEESCELTLKEIQKFKSI